MSAVKHMLGMGLYRSKSKVLNHAVVCMYLVKVVVKVAAGLSFLRRQASGRSTSLTRARKLVSLR